MAVGTLEEFVQLLFKSGLLTEAQIQEALQGQSSPDADPKSLARWLVQKELLTRWQAGAMLAGRRTLRLGEHQLADQLAADDFGVVYLAQHDQLGPRVIKTLAREHTKDAAAVKRFTDDARVTSALDHPNLARTFDVRQEGDRFYVVAEYIQGTDLQRLIEHQGPLSNRQTADILRRTAEGLARAHQAGLIHRALKPASLMVDSSGAVKILNWGIGHLPRSGACQAFLAPEQRTAGQGDADHRTDIFALGCVGFYMLTGKSPVDQHDGVYRLRDIREVLHIRRDAPERLLKICQKMMAIHPAQRFGSAAAAAKYLRIWLEETEKKSVAGALNDPAKHSTPPAEPMDAPTPAAAPTTVKTTEVNPVSSSQVIDDSPEMAPLLMKPDARWKSAEPDPPPGVDSIDAVHPSVAVVGPGSVTSNAPGVATGTGPVAISRKPRSAIRAKRNHRKKSNAPLIVGGVAAAALLLIGLTGGLLYIVLNHSGGKSIAQGGPSALDSSVVDAEEAPEHLLEDDTFSESEDESDDQDNHLADESQKQPTPNSLEESNDNAIQRTSFPGAADHTDQSAQPMEGNEPSEFEAPSMPTEPLFNQPEDESPTPVPEALAMVGADSTPSNRDELANSDTPATPAKPAIPAESASKKPPTTDPFRDLPSRVQKDLPPLENTEPVVLGAVDNHQHDAFHVELYGGDIAIGVGRSKLRFVEENGANRTSTRDWEIFLQQGEEGQKTMIAKIAVTLEKQLQFQWTGQAAENPHAVYLRNCVFSLRSDASEHHLALRKKVLLPPLEIDLVKAGKKLRSNITAPPNSDHVRLEVVSVQGDLGQPKFEPAKELESHKGETSLRFGPLDLQAIVVQLKSTFGGGSLAITASSFLQPTPKDRPQRLSTKRLADLEREAARRSFTARQNANMYRALLTREKVPKKTQKTNPRLLNLERAWEQSRTVLRSIDQLKAYVESAKGGAKVYFQLYYDAGPVRVVLAGPDESVVAAARNAAIDASGPMEKD